MKTTQHHIKKKAKKHLANILDVLKVPGENELDEDVHQLRVSIKKLKALLYYVAFINGDQKYREVFEPFKELFKAAGKYREAQLLLRACLDFKDIEPVDKTKIEDIVSIDKSKALEEFKGLLDKGIAEKLQKKAKEIDKLIVQNEKVDGKKYFGARGDKLSKIMGSEQLIADEIHEARKLLKELIYNAKLVKRKKIIPVMKIDVKEADVFLDKVGLWHDKRVESKAIKLFVTGHENMWKDSKRLENLNAMLANKELALRNEVITGLKALVK